MKIKLFPLLAFLALLPLSALAQLTVSTGYSSGTHLDYNATGVVTSGTVVMSGSADSSFVSDTHITLAAGFKVAVGALFRAKAGPDVDGDGMPNAWEITNSLNLQVNDAASDPDSDGIPNQTEYQLSTNPHTPGGTPNTSDTSNTTALKIHKPN